MDWKKYRRKYRALASKRGHNDESISMALRYAKKLYAAGLPIIFDQEHLACLVGYDVSYLRRASNDITGSFYRTFKIKKRSSDSLREISEPLPSLKEIQRWILDNILYRIPVSAFSKAYSKKSSIKKNARFHVGQKYLVRIDVKDFFPSISEQDVYYIFRRAGYSQEVSGILAGLTTYSEELPQGAPTSPALANIFMVHADKRMAGYCLPKGIRFTRYADDLTFSGEFDCDELISFVRQVLLDNHLVLNESKTKIMHKHNQQRTTGLVVNERVNTPRILRRKLRQEIYYIQRYGLAGHLNHLKNTRANYLNHLLGVANFILFINNKDKEARKAKSLIKELLLK